MGFAPTTNFGSNDLQLWRQIEFPGTNGQVLRAGAGDFTTGRLIAAQPRAHGAGPGLTGRLRTDLRSARGSPTGGWGLGYMLNQRGVNGPNLMIFGHGGPVARLGSSTRDRIGYAYVMNRLTLAITRTRAASSRPTSSRQRSPKTVPDG